ncbi:MAG: carboxypeptidase-like regulatory domain-containing protein, partial [Cyclobacteriaceae bacterium]|nr:carboxypeptidase-like regulatory domain-containing protein [Cyclobacteriaceae bacterium]
SIDKNNLPKGAHYEERPYKLSEEEIKDWSKYFMMVKLDQKEKYSYIVQSKKYYLFNNENQYTTSHLTGPFYYGDALFKVRDAYETSFKFEPGYSYEFDEGLLKMKSNTARYNFNRYMSSQPISPNFSEISMQYPQIKSYWEFLDKKTIRGRYPLFEANGSPVGRLKVRFPDSLLTSGVSALYIYDLNNPENQFIYSWSENGSITFLPGKYSLAILFMDGQYLRNTIEIKSEGLNYYNFTHSELIQPDSFSEKIHKLIEKWGSEKSWAVMNRRVEFQELKKEFIATNSENYNFDHTVQGRIYDTEVGEGLPGVNIVVKGTTHGTVSDIDGYYQLSVPPGGILVFSFIGYTTIEQNVGNSSNIDVNMEADIQQLSEVVVTGYGVQRSKHTLGYATATVSYENGFLAGKVAGVNISSASGLPGSVSLLKLRGASSLPVLTDSSIMVIIDGVPMDYNSINQDKIKDISILKGESASAIYGSRAQNGVIIISTKSGISAKQLIIQAEAARDLISMPQEAMRTRKNFKDYAYWQPELTTDENGKNTFTVSYPDNISGWNNHFIAIKGKKSGYTSTTTFSYKPLMAQVSLPHFLIKGDFAEGIGKITNYSSDTLSLFRTLTINGVTKIIDSLRIGNSHIDPIKMEVTDEGDSLSVDYSLNYKTYKDGEIRKIPIYRQGVRQVDGIFIPLLKDTTINLSEELEGKVSLFAQKDVIDVLMDEIEYLKKYPHGCNEQTASKLRAYLLSKKIAEYKKIPFKESDEIIKLIKKLIANQNKDGGWSWWGSGESRLWVSLHVGKILLDAKKMGFGMAMDEEAFKYYLMQNYNGENHNDQMNAALLLLEMNEKVVTDGLQEKIEDDSLELSLHQKLLTLRVLQKAGDKIDLQWLDTLRNKTIKGNHYWERSESYFFENRIMNTLLVFNLKKDEGVSADTLNPILHYFFERRKRYWRNTYESAHILETILPELIEKQEKFTPSTLAFSGDLNETVEEFPFEKEIESFHNLSLTKKGSEPVYFTAYSETFNENPLPVTDVFEVKTKFNTKDSVLIAGKPVILEIEVDVKKDAEYMMIEVPIPAGCSYENKNKSYAYGEVHREYYYHTTNIYVQNMKKGKYHYSISLVPRFTGKYIINPTLVSSMYFPTIYGRDGMKNIVIEKEVK